MKLKLAFKQIEETVDTSKEYNWSKKGKKIILEEVSAVDPKVWTKQQQVEIDEIKSDIKILKSDVSELKQDMVEVKTELRDLRSDMNLIINHLGIKR